MRIIVLFITFVFILASCKKAEDRPCFKGVGDETTVEIELASFETLFLGPHLNYILVQDTLGKVVLTGGERKKRKRRKSRRRKNESIGKN